MDTKLTDPLTDWPHIAEIACFHPINSHLYSGFRSPVRKVFEPSHEYVRFANLYHMSTIVHMS